MPRSSAQRRYVGQGLIMMTAYVVLLIGAQPAFPPVEHNPPLAYALAVLPAPPLLGVFWAIGRLLLEERDEYLRDQLVRQSLIATGFALSVATVWGFLESFDLVPHVDAYFAAILWFAGLGVGGFANWLARPRADEDPA